MTKCGVVTSSLIYQLVETTIHLEHGFCHLFTFYLQFVNILTDRRQWSIICTVHNTMRLATTDICM